MFITEISLLIQGLLNSSRKTKKPPPRSGARAQRFAVPPCFSSVATEPLICPSRRLTTGITRGTFTPVAQRRVQILTVPVRSTTGSLGQCQTLLLLFNAFNSLCSRAETSKSCQAVRDIFLLKIFVLLFVLRFFGNLLDHRFAAEIPEDRPNRAGNDIERGNGKKHDFWLGNDNDN